MRLYEDLQEDIIENYKAVLNAYENLKDEVKSFVSVCSDEEKDIKEEANYLDDFISEEVQKKIDYMKDAILDVYYPVDYGDNENDYKEAGDAYRQSLDTRKSIFDEK